MLEAKLLELYILERRQDLHSSFRLRMWTFVRVTESQQCLHRRALVFAEWQASLHHERQHICWPILKAKHQAHCESKWEFTCTAVRIHTCLHRTLSNYAPLQSLSSSSTQFGLAVRITARCPKSACSLWIIPAERSLPCAVCIRPSLC
eukprot:gnl/TRDRNA2_/TRDRNA2_61654_c0_seq1.p1 gnl/TRDRNA2_/TRDRNA2_61654_c0~~gnl/TRDRNA2_/TRDRNA2_61654_c0_seq1.p1  ORF type:complete len:148 (-),score=17.91 gnl/TRDRNA2_/TRDRNA2_61654_c0_seq1:68-511(-)